MCLMQNLEHQSPDIASGVWVDHQEEEVGAGDQVWKLKDLLNYFRGMSAVFKYLKEHLHCT